MNDFQWKSTTSLTVLKVKMNKLLTILKKFILFLKIFLLQMNQKGTCKRKILFLLSEF